MGQVNAGRETLPMTVAKLGFMLDRLGQDCAPLQFLRELTQNSIEAITAIGEPGEIIWDVDWDYFDLTGIKKLCIIDTGVGMTGGEMVHYVNQLSSSGREQAFDKNFGVGAKIAGVTRNHEGLIYLSWKDDVGSMIHLWRDPLADAYGLKQLENPDGTFGHWGYLEDSVKPEQIDAHGTKVVLMGMSPGEETVEAPHAASSPKKWTRRYLNTRYFRFPEGVTVRVREGWDHPRADTALNRLQKVTGQEQYLDQHSDAKGSVDLTNAVAQWWLLRDDSSLAGNSGQIASRGHMAALFQDELYEMVEARPGVARLQLFGVVFGYQRVVIYVEPKHGNGNTVTSNTARTTLIMNGEPLPWAEWAAEFREQMPEEIVDMMNKLAGNTDGSSHRDAYKDRIRRLRDLFKFSRYRPTEKGTSLIDDASMTRGGQSEASASSKDGDGASGKSGGKAGNVYALFLKQEGVNADEVNADPFPKVDWVRAADGTRAAGFLEDRAAKFMPELNLLQINADFRGFTDMIDLFKAEYEGVPGAEGAIRQVVEEWFEQQLVEAVIGVQMLQRGQAWSIADIANAWSEEALTAAVMPRYHVWVNVKRGVRSRMGTVQSLDPVSV